MHTGGIILCGGRSTRMGMPKATLPFGGELMVQRVVRLLGQVVQPLVVVAAPDQLLPQLPHGVLVARDRREGRGPLEGLYAGLNALAPYADAAYATSCDTPLLSIEFVRRMIDELADHQTAVPVEPEGFHHPLAAVYRTDITPHLAQLLAVDQLRPVFLYDRLDTRRVPVEQLRDVDPDLKTLSNLNRPEDYFRALKEAGLEPPPEIIEQLRRD